MFRARRHFVGTTGRHHPPSRLATAGTKINHPVGGPDHIEIAELMDIMGGLIALGYVDCDFTSISNSEAFKKARFRVNSGYSHDLKEALDPRPEPPKSRRVRRE